MARYSLGAQTVATTGDLSGLSATPGTIVVVEELLDGFMFVAGSTLAQNGVTVLAGTGGVWQRLGWGAEEWRNQGAWFIDETNGADTNPGTALAPLASFDEFVRRVRGGRLKQLTEVTIIGNLSTGLEGTIETDRIPNGIEIKGQVVTIGTHSIAAATALAAATNTPPQITVAGLDWTAAGYVGKRIRLTTGAGAGATAWVMKDLGAGAARLTQWYRQSAGAFAFYGAEQAALAGDVIAVENLPVIAGPVDLMLRTNGPEFVTLANATVRDLEFTNERFALSSGTQQPVVVMVGLKLAPMRMFVSATCLSCAVRVISGAGVMPPSAGGNTGPQFQACGFIKDTGSTLPFYGGVLALFDSGCLSQGVTISLSSGAVGTVGGASGSGLGIFDVSGNCLMVTHTSSVDIRSPLWGDNNIGGYALNCNNWGKYDNVSRFTCVNAGGQLRIGGVVKLFAELPYWNPSGAASLVLRTT